MFRKTLGAIFIALTISFAVAQQTTTTPGVQLQIPGYGSSNWQVPLSYNMNRIDKFLSGQLPVPSLHVVNLNADNFTPSAANIVGSLGFNPLNPANNLSDVPNAAQALNNLGAMSVNAYQGAWSGTATYFKGQIVTYSGASYFSLATPNTGNVPATSPAQWGSLASANPTIAASVISDGTVATALTFANSAVAEATTSATDVENMGESTTNRYGIQNFGPLNGQLIDFRQRQFLHYCYNNVITNECRSLNSLWTTSNNVLSGHINTHINTTEASLGTYDTGYWSGSYALTIDHTSYSKGIDQPLSMWFEKWGIGDWTQYHYMNYSTGSPAGDDEGGNGDSLQMRENGSDPRAVRGTLTDGSTGATGIHYNQLSGGGVGAGRPAIIVKNASGGDGAWFTSTVTGLDGWMWGGFTSNMGQTLDTPDAVSAISTGWGHVVNAAGTSFPIGATELDPPSTTFDTPQPVTFNVVVDGGSSAGYHTGYACMDGGTHYEKIPITAVSGSAGVGNTQVISAMLRQRMNIDFNHVPIRLYQDTIGLCGSYLSIVAGNRGDATTPIRQVVPIMGATTTTHVVYSMPSGNYHGTISGAQNEEMFTEMGTVAITRAGNVATMTITWPATTPFTPNWANRSISITGTTDFNGTVTLAPTATANVYTFASSGSNITSAESGSAIYNAGRNVVKFYYGAEVIGVTDPDSSQQVFGHYMQFPANEAPWAAGDTVEVPNFWYMPVSQRFDTMFAFSAHATGWQFLACCDAVSDHYKLLTLENTQPLTTYQGFGGNLKVPEAAIAIGGPVQTVIDTNFYLSQNGGAIVPGGNFATFNCPLHLSGQTDCQQPNDAWTMFYVPTKNYNNISHVGVYVTANVPNDSIDIKYDNSLYQFGANNFALGDVSAYPNNMGPYLLYTTGNGANSRTVHVGAGANLYVDGYYGTGVADYLGVLGVVRSDITHNGNTGNAGYLNSGFAWYNGANQGVGMQYCSFWTQDQRLCLGTPTNNGANNFDQNQIGGESLQLPEVDVDRRGYAVEFAGGLAQTYITVQNYVYTGSLPLQTSGVHYSLAAVAPDGTMGQIQTGSRGFDVGVPVGGAPYDATDYVTITCPAAKQANHPTGTTYYAFRVSGGNPLWGIQPVGVCPIGGTLVDNGQNWSVTMYRPPNANGPMYAGQFLVSLGGAIGFRNNNYQWDAGPFGGNNESAWITNPSGKNIAFGSARGGVDANLEAGTVQLSNQSITCSSTTAGTFNYIAGATGVKDSVQVCAKDATNAYAWRTIY